MNYLMVDLYKDFRCSADACPNTCCAGWRIIVDEDAYQKMVDHQKELGTPAADWIEKEEDGLYTVKLAGEQRCPMLTEKNLCRVVLNLGPDYQCITCMEYPRILRTFGSVLEGSLSMSCPEVIARLMDKTGVQFDLVSDDNPGKPFEHMTLYRFAGAVRSGMVDIIQHTADIFLVTRLFAAYDILCRAVEFYEKMEMDASFLQAQLDQYLREEVLYSLDGYLQKGIDGRDQYRFVKDILPVIDGESGRWRQLILLTIEYFERAGVERYEKGMERFKEHLAVYKTFYINYWIYRIFQDVMEIPEYGKSKERFIYSTAQFCLIQSIAFVVFARNGFLGREDYIFIISSVSRMMEHNTTVRKDLVAKLNEFHALSPAGLLMMIIA